MLEFIVKYWMEFAFGAIIAIFSMGYRKVLSKIQERTDEQKQIKDGLKAILHDRLFQSGMYFIEQGEIPVSALDNLAEIYKAYNKLGGNSTGTEVFERLQELELKK